MIFEVLQLLCLILDKKQNSGRQSRPTVLRALAEA